MTIKILLDTNFFCQGDYVKATRSAAAYVQNFRVFFGAPQTKLNEVTLLMSLEELNKLKSMFQHGVEQELKGKAQA